MPSRKNILSWILVTGLVLTGLTACKGTKEKNILSQDGSFRMTVPGAWKERKNLHEDAQLQASDRGGDMFAIVLVDAKVDFEDLDLQGHSDITRNGMAQTLGSFTEVGPTELTIDGKPALQYEVHGTFDRLKVIYIHTTVEGADRFYQIVAWTTPSHFNKYRPTLEKITQLFQETQ